jgi:hypothetical protein
MAWLGAGLLCLLLAASVRAPIALGLLVAAGVGGALFVYAGIQVLLIVLALLIAQPLLAWAAKRDLTRRLFIPLVFVGASFTLFGLLGPKEGLF